jgi:hypothetical protein
MASPALDTEKARMAMGEALDAATLAFELCARRKATGRRDRAIDAMVGGRERRGRLVRSGRKHGRQADGGEAQRKDRWELWML